MSVTGLLPAEAGLLGACLQLRASPTIAPTRPYGGQMLFDRRLGHPGAELLDVGGHGRWPDSVQPQATLLAAIEELPDRQSVRHAGGNFSTTWLPVASYRQTRPVRCAVPSMW